MAKARSPGYPVIGLKEAIERVTAIYAKDYQNRIPRAVVALHAGYQTLNGKALGVLATLSKFGLLEGRGDENRVTDLALKIIAHSPGEPERTQAIVQAAVMPEIFAEIQARYPEGASDGAIRSYLLTQKFIPVAADMAVRSYRETMDLVASEGGAYPTAGHTKEDDGPVERRHLQHVDLSRSFQVPHESPRLSRPESQLRPNDGTDREERGERPLNDIKAVLERNTLRISAWVDKRGLRRLKRILAANEPLMDEDDDEGQDATALSIEAPPETPAS